MKKQVSKRNVTSAQIKIRIVLIYLLFLVSNMSMAQQLEIILKAGDKVTTQFKATSNTTLFTVDGNYKFVDISEVKYPDYSDQYASKYNQIEQGLERAGNSNVPEQSIQQRVLTTPSKDEEVVQITTQELKKYKNNSSAGKVFQMAGGILIGYSTYKIWKDAQDRQDDPLKEIKLLSPAIPLIGMGAFGIGIVIDLNANNHLK